MTILNPRTYHVFSRAIEVSQLTILCFPPFQDHKFSIVAGVAADSDEDSDEDEEDAPEAMDQS